MKRIALAVLAGGLALSALALGSAKNANAAEFVVERPGQVQVVERVGYYAPGPYYGPYRGRVAFERQRAWRIHEREVAHRRWLYLHGY